MRRLRGKVIKFQLWERSSAFDRFRTFNRFQPSLIRGTAGVFIFYDTTNKESLTDDAKGYAREIEVCRTLLLLHLEADT